MPVLQISGAVVSLIRLSNSSQMPRLRNSQRHDSYYSSSVLLVKPKQKKKARQEIRWAARAGGRAKIPPPPRTVLPGGGGKKILRGEFGLTKIFLQKKLLLMCFFKKRMEIIVYAWQALAIAALTIGYFYHRQRKTKETDTDNSSTESSTESCSSSDDGTADLSTNLPTSTSMDSYDDCGKIGRSEQTNREKQFLGTLDAVQNSGLGECCVEKKPRKGRNF